MFSLWHQISAFPLLLSSVVQAGKTKITACLATFLDEGARKVSCRRDNMTNFFISSLKKWHWYSWCVNTLIIRKYTNGKLNMCQPDTFYNTSNKVTFISSTQRLISSFFRRKKKRRHEYTLKISKTVLNRPFLQRNE